MATLTTLYEAKGIRGYRERTIKAVLTNAEIKALVTTPIQLAAAPGAGKFYEIRSADLYLDVSAGAYTNINVDFADIGIRYGGLGAIYATSRVCNDTTVAYGDAVGPLNDFSAMFGTAAKGVARLIPQGYIDAYNASDGLNAYFLTEAQIFNQPLKIDINNNGSGDLTGGNGANTLTAVVTYILVIP